MQRNGSQEERGSTLGGARVSASRKRRTTTTLWIGFVLAVGGSCATASDIGWMKIGATIRDEVTERYGEPDLVIVSSDGDTVTYRPTTGRTAPPSVELPSVQAGPFGTAATGTQSVGPGLGARSIASGTDERPPYEFQIRYDRRGIVQGVVRSQCTRNMSPTVLNQGSYWEATDEPRIQSCSY